MLKLFGIIFFCGLLSPSQEVLSGLSCAVSPGALQKGNQGTRVMAGWNALWSQDAEQNLPFS